MPTIKDKKKNVKTVTTIGLIIKIKIKEKHREIEKILPNKNRHVI